MAGVERMNSGKKRLHHDHLLLVQSFCVTSISHLDPNRLIYIADEAR